MDLIIYPNSLKGTIFVPPSKSYTHRAYIAAALAGGGTIENPLISEDTNTTLNVISDLGYVITRNLNIVEILKQDNKNKKVFYGFDSGSTIRFLLPIISLYHSQFIFKGSTRLMERLDYLDLDALVGLRIKKKRNELCVKGVLNEQEYYLSGKRTSQLISGMIFTLPFLKGVRLHLNDITLENPYLKMTLDICNRFGVEYEVSNNTIIARTSFVPTKVIIEGDYSHAANWLVASIFNKGLRVCGLNPNSIQGDKNYFNLTEKLGIKYKYEDDSFEFLSGEIGSTLIDINDTPDLGPILAALASVGKGRIEIIGTNKLQYKESNRLKSTMEAINALGGNIIVNDERMVIEGKGQLKGGGVVDCASDHRIIMALIAISSKIKHPFIIKGTKAINKSYPDFFTHFKAVGGKAKRYEENNCKLSIK